MEETYAAEQAYIDASEPVSDELVDTLTEIEFEHIRSIASLGAYKATLSYSRDSKVFEEIADRLQDVGYIASRKCMTDRHKSTLTY